jgi:hypothetical protein
MSERRDQAPADSRAVYDVSRKLGWLAASMSRMIGKTLAANCAAYALRAAHMRCSALMANQQFCDSVHLDQTRAVTRYSCSLEGYGHEKAYHPWRPGYLLSSSWRRNRDDHLSATGCVQLRQLELLSARGIWMNEFFALLIATMAGASTVIAFTRVRRS